MKPDRDLRGLPEAGRLRADRAMAQAQGALVAALRAGSVEQLMAMAPMSALHVPAGIRGGLPRALQAYRLNGVVLAERALTAVYPRLQAVMEADQPGSFAALAWACWRSEGPHEADVGRWGEVLVRMLDEAVLSQGLPWSWADLARVEWAVHQSERQDLQPFDVCGLAPLASESPAAVRLVLHPSVHCLSITDATLLEGEPSAARRPAVLPPSGSRSLCDWLVWRDGWRAVSAPLDDATGRWMRALQAGLSLEQALSAAGDRFDFSQWLPAALRSGWILAVQPATQGAPHGGIV